MFLNVYSLRLFLGPTFHNFANDAKCRASIIWGFLVNANSGPRDKKTINICAECMDVVEVEDRRASPSRSAALMRPVALGALSGALLALGGTTCLTALTTPSATVHLHAPPPAASTTRSPSGRLGDGDFAHHRPLGASAVGDTLPAPELSPTAPVMHVDSRDVLARDLQTAPPPTAQRPNDQLPQAARLHQVLGRGLAGRRRGRGAGHCVWMCK